MRERKESAKAATPSDASASAASHHAGKESEAAIPWFIAFTTYFGYATLIIFGHLRDIFGKAALACCGARQADGEPKRGWSRYFSGHTPKVRLRAGARGEAGRIVARRALRSVPALGPPAHPLLSRTRRPPPPHSLPPGVLASRRFRLPDSPPLQGYAPLLQDWENFYTRRLYHRIQDCWNRPISGPPTAAGMRVVVRASPDGNFTLQCVA
jgi:hypothetical protein